MEELIDRNSYDKKLPYETAVLVLGICSIIGAFLYAIPGIICAIIALALSKPGLSMVQTESNSKGYEKLKAGKICAIIGLIFSILMALIITLVVIFIVQHRNDF